MQIGFGLIMQPVMFEVPPDLRPRDYELSRRLIASNEQAIERVRGAGFDTVWVEDHMKWGDGAHLECFTNMAWLVGRHPGLRWGTMVCAQRFRNPGYLAKLAVNMDVLTNSQFILGIGAGSGEQEHRSYGFPFRSPAERLLELEEAVTVLRLMWTSDRPTFLGRYYAIDGPILSPLPSSCIPIMIGGAGERRTLRLVARYADWWCHDVGSVARYARKRQVLAAHCEAIDRDPSTIVHSQVVWIRMGFDAGDRARWPGLHIVGGTADGIVDELASFVEAGVRYFHVRFMDHPETDGLERFAADVVPRLQR